MKKFHYFTKSVCLVFAFVFTTSFVSAGNVVNYVRMYVVNTNRLNIREYNDVESRVKGQLQKGDTIYVTLRDNGMCSVRWIQQHGSPHKLDYKHAGWVKEAHLTNITNQYTQKDISKALYPDLWKARHDLLLTGIAIGVLLLFSVLCLLLYDLAYWICAIAVALWFYILPIVIPALLCQYFYFHNDGYSAWFILEANGYGWIGYIAWAIVTILAIVFITNNIKRFFSNWENPLYTIVGIFSAAGWGYYVWLSLGGIISQDREGFVTLLTWVLFVAFLGGGGALGASMPTSSTLSDSYGRTVTTGRRSGDIFVADNGDRYTKNTDGSWRKN